MQSTLETFVGFGYIVGPTLGGALYQVRQTVDLIYSDTQCETVWLAILEDLSDKSQLTYVLEKALNFRKNRDMKL